MVYHEVGKHLVTGYTAGWQDRTGLVVLYVCGHFDRFKVLSAEGLLN